MTLKLLLAAVIAAGIVGRAEALDKPSVAETIAAAAQSARDPQFKIGETNPFKVLPRTERKEYPGIPTRGITLSEFARAFLKEARPFGVQEVVLDAEAGKVMLDLPGLPMLSPMALLQAVCCRYGFVAQFSDDKKAVLIDPLEKAWGKPEDVFKALLAECDRAATPNADLGELGYLFASLVAFPDQGTIYLNFKGLKHREHSVKYISANALVASRQAASAGALLSPYYSWNSDVRFSGVRLSFLNADEEFIGIIRDRVKDLARVRSGKSWPAIRAATSEFLRSDVKLRPENIPLLMAFKDLFAGDDEVLKLFDAHLDKLPMPAKPVIPEPTAERLRARNALAAAVNGASDPKFDFTARTYYSNLPVSKVTVFKFAELLATEAKLRYRIVVNEPAADGYYRIVVNDPAASAVEIELHEIPMLSPIALLQAVCARHGFVAIADKKKGEIAIDTMERAWGKKEDVWPEILQKCVELKKGNERDLGKVAYLLGSALAFSFDDLKFLRHENFYSRDVQFIGFNIMLAAKNPPKMDLAEAIYNLSPNPRFAGLRLALAVPNVRFDVDDYMRLLDEVPDFKPQIVGDLRTTLLEAIGTVRKFGEGQKGVLESLRKVFADDKEITGLLDAKLKALAPKR